MPNDDSTIIEVEDLGAAYDGRRILEHVSFKVRRGSIVTIIGGSGCGKTTLLKHMIGLLRPEAGRVRIGGEDLATASGRQRLAILRQIGVMYQGGALFGSLSLLENVRLPLEEHTRLPRRAMDQIATLKLAMVGLNGQESFLPSEISGGMTKRAAIARAMALDPEILFLDEPSAGLDPITSDKLDKLIVKLAQTLSITFVIVTHEIHSVLAIGDWLIMLDKKTRGIVVEGPPKEVAANSEIPLVRRFFRRDEEDDDRADPAEE